MDEVFQTFHNTGFKWWDLKHPQDAEESFQVSEFWLDNATRSIKVNDRDVKPDQRDAWLETKINEQGYHLIARFVWLTADASTGAQSQEVNLSKSAMEYLRENFGLEVAYNYFQTFISGVQALPRTSTPDFDRQAFAFCFGPKVAAIWSHTMNKNPGQPPISEGIFFTKATPKDASKKGPSNPGEPAPVPLQTTLRRILKHVSWDHRFCLTSAFPAYLFSLVLSSQIEESHKKVQLGIKKIEALTGYHEFEDRKMDTVYSNQTETLVQFSAEASGYASRLASVGRKSKMVEQLLDFMLRRAKEDVGHQQRLSTDTEEVVHIGPDVHQLVENHVEVMKGRMVMQSSETQYIRKRVQIQISAIFHMITQNDTLSNLAIAEETSKITYYSYRDASSMKTLAYVTMFLLPGTFVSGLFSTNLFDWDSRDLSRSDVIGVTTTPQFRLFWAITIPLTIFVFALYYLWLWVQKQQMRKRNLKAQNDPEEARIFDEKDMPMSPTSELSKNSRIRHPKGLVGLTMADTLKRKRINTNKMRSLP